MKIDYRLKNRIRFNQLEDEAKKRLRRFYHFTSAEAALQILQAGAIWSDQDDVAPYFCANRQVKAGYEGSQEICLTFRFTGNGHLVPEDGSSNDYQPNALYVHLYEWPDMYSLEGMRVAELRVSAGTASGLECIAFHPSEDFLERCKTDIGATIVLTRIKRLMAAHRVMRVPADGQEREALRAKYPPFKPTTLDIWRMQWHLFLRRWQKKRAAAGKP